MLVVNFLFLAALVIFCSAFSLTYPKASFDPQEISESNNDPQQDLLFLIIKQAAARKSEYEFSPDLRVLKRSPKDSYGTQDSCLSKCSVYAMCKILCSAVPWPIQCYCKYPEGCECLGNGAN